MPMAARAVLGNLPAELTSFVGRDREVGEVKRRLAGARLVSLVGVGGTGKTRLALRVAGQVQRAFPHGVWFVDLTQLHDVGLIGQEVQDPDVLAFLVKATLGLREQGGGPPLRVLTEQLADRQMLLILDNCEHLLPACAVLANTLLRGCPGMRILVTSREPLAVAGEMLLPIPPLSAPDPGQRPSLAALSRCESVALFLTRAQAALPGFELTEENHAAVADLCHRLDGLPLAIELAAAQVRVLALDQIVERIADRFGLLSRGSRNAPERQQTLGACVNWSFDLCAKPERMLWARLSVFAGGFELDAVEGVCADETLPEADLLDLVTGLMDKSILTRADIGDGQAPTVRYQMLETIREYGHQKLHRAGEDVALRRRHRDWYERLVTRASVEGVIDRPAYWMARLTREQSNLRAALELGLTEPRGAEATLRLAVSLPPHYWSGSGLLGEGRRWLDRALAQASPPTALRARAFLINSHLATWQGDADAAMRLLDEGEELARRLDASPELGHAASIRGVGALYGNDLPVAVESLTRAWTMLSKTPDADLYLYLNVLTGLGVAAGMAGDYERASACHQEMLAIVEPRGGGRHRSLARWLGGLIDWHRGDLEQAAEQEMEALRLQDTWGSDDQFVTAVCLELLAWITVAQQRYRRAATLLGAADARWTDVGTPVTANLQHAGHRSACERQTRDALGDTAFADTVARGRALPYEDAIAYALEEPRQRPSTPHEDASTALTRREREVADLMAQGLSNREIAGRLVISQRTAESHVEHILTKLGLANRAQVAAWKTAQLVRGL